MRRATAVGILARLHDAQNAFYRGESGAQLQAVLGPEIVWTVPGANAIAGVHRGTDAVLDYMARRRDLAHSTFRMTPRDVMTGDGDLVAVHTDGAARIGGVEESWSTIGLYRLTGHQIAACWLLPLDPVAFDRIWTAR